MQPITHIDGIANLSKTVEGNHLLEIVKESISVFRVWEIGDGGWSRPGDYRDEEDANQKSTSYAVKHQDEGEDAMRHQH